MYLKFNGIQRSFQQQNAQVFFQQKHKHRTLQEHVASTFYPLISMYMPQNFQINPSNPILSTKEYETLQQKKSIQKPHSGILCRAGFQDC